MKLIKPFCRDTTLSGSFVIDDIDLEREMPEPNTMEIFADFKIVIRKFFFEDIPKIKDELSKRINDNFQRIHLNSIKLPAV